jgi:hypothetical protein
MYEWWMEKSGCNGPRNAQLSRDRAAIAPALHDLSWPTVHYVLVRLQNKMHHMIDD